MIQTTEAFAETQITDQVKRKIRKPIADIELGPFPRHLPHICDELGRILLDNGFLLHEGSC